MSLWTLRFRKPQMVSTGLMDVPTRTNRDDEFLTAQRMGQRYCDGQPGYRYIGVERAILVDGSILDEPVVAEPVQAPVHKPTPAEQAEALKARGPRVVQPSVHETGRVGA